MKRRNALLLSGSALITAILPEVVEASDVPQRRVTLWPISLGWVLRHPLNHSEAAETLAHQVRSKLVQMDQLGSILFQTGLPQVAFSQAGVTQVSNFDFATRMNVPIHPSVINEWIRHQTNWVRNIASAQIGWGRARVDCEALILVEGPDKKTVQEEALRALNPSLKRTKWCFKRLVQA